MKKVATMIMIVLLIAACIFSSACAETAKVDVVSLKTIEQEDCFAVKVTDKQIERSTSAIRVGDCDSLLITVRNDLSTDIAGVTIMLVAYDDDFTQVEIGNGFGSITGIKTPQTISGSFTIKTQSEETVAFKCNAEKFAGVRMIVSEYKLENGSAVKNETADEWYSMAYVGHKMEIVRFDEEKDYSGVTVKSGETVHVTNLKSIEETDTFPVKVTHKKITYNAGDDLALGGNDRLTITIRNESGAVILNPVIYVISYNENLEPKSLDIIKTEFPYVQVLTARENETISILPNSEQICIMSCNGKDISGMRAIIAGYEDEEGNKTDNPAAALWLNQMLSGNVSNLD